MLNTLNIMVMQFITLAAKSEPNLYLRPDSWKQTLPALVIGMLGIFLVIGVIIASTYLLNKAFSKKKDKNKEDE